MPIVITYLYGSVDHVEGESWAKLDADSPRLGTINLKSLRDGHRIIVNKNSISKVEEFPQAVWDSEIAEHKKREADERTIQVRQHAQSQISQWNRQPWWKKVFRKCPITLPAELAEKKV